MLIGLSKERIKNPQPEPRYVENMETNKTDSKIVLETLQRTLLIIFEPHAVDLRAGTNLLPSSIVSKALLIQSLDCF